mgnify:CR=1 FL=1
MVKITHSVCGGTIGIGEFKTYYTKEKRISWDDGYGGGGSYKRYKAYGFCPLCGERLNPSEDTARTEKETESRDYA